MNVKGKERTWGGEEKAKLTVQQPHPGIVRIKRHRQPAIIIYTRGVPSRGSFPVQFCRVGRGIKGGGALAQDEEIVAV
jgi:hypothetical protein